MENKKGQSLFEVVLALAVITAVIVAIIILATNTIRNANFSKTKTEATRYAQEATEWLRGERDADFDTFRTNALSINWCFTTLSFGPSQLGLCSEGEVIPGTQLRREATFSEITATSIDKAEVRVYWSDAQGTHEVKTITSFTDWSAQ